VGFSPTRRQLGSLRRIVRARLRIRLLRGMNGVEACTAGTAHQQHPSPEFDVKFRIETILQQALDCKCSETFDMVQANPDRNGDKQCIG
jgi:hypothetical protein